MRQDKGGVSSNTSYIDHGSCQDRICELETKLAEAERDCAMEMARANDSEAREAVLVELIRSPRLRWEHTDCGMIDSPHMHQGMDCDERHPCDCGLEEASKLDTSPRARELLAYERAWKWWYEAAFLCDGATQRRRMDAILAEELERAK